MNNLMLVLPALGFDFFNEDASEPEPNSILDSEVSAHAFEFRLQREGISATASLENGRFIVLRGSRARESWVGRGSEASSYGRLYQELVDQGILVMDGETRVFAKDYAFKSTSAAAAVVSGRPASGPQSWLVKGTNKSYSEWEAERL